MKNLILTFLICFIAGSFSFAQNSVQLNIKHKLGNSDFEFATGATNNLGDDFNITRMEYYITEFTIVHDGGQETEVNDIWVLVNANETTEIDLGSHDVTEVESIIFHLGVDEAHNHLDPASYDSDHPLAPKNPSMHWGWTSGYRFAALEGNGGPAYNNVIELHGLGDENYFEIQTNISATAVSNIVIIDLNADYTRALEDLSINDGLINHSTSNEALKLLTNFQEHVFNVKTGTSSTVDFSEVKDLAIFPNPTTDGSSTVLINATEDYTYQVSVTDILGQQVQAIESVNSNEAFDLKLESAGLYFVNLVKDGQTIISKKLIAN